MARVQFFLTQVHPKLFSGGQLTVCEYANGLAARGHDVTVVALQPSRPPEWCDAKFRFHSPQPSFSRKRALRALLKRDAAAWRGQAQAWLLKRSKSYVYHRAVQVEGIRDRLPPADVTVSTSFDTALPNYVYGTGRKFYFAQHFEPYLCGETTHPELARLDALGSYHLPGLQQIANSTWLADMLERQTGTRPPTCLNAIDFRNFYPDGAPPPADERFVVISYGGRNAAWKGFADAAEAIRLAREQIPRLEWRVFGSALLPPDNTIAAYTPTGFIVGDALRQAYSTSHALLAPSWYESFPLFPLEAMACGVAVVTTPHGVEDYARDGENALIVPPREPERMAEALVTLYRDAALRKRLAANGAEQSKALNWDRAVARMAELLGL